MTRLVLSIVGLVVTIGGMSLLVWGCIRMRRAAESLRDAAESFQVTQERLARPYRVDKQEPRCYPIYKELQPGDDPRRADEK